MSKQPVRAHLLDMLLFGIVLPPLPTGTNFVSPEETFAHNAALRAVLGGAVCIEATNVARFFNSTYLSDFGSFDPFFADLKCLVPPYKRFFVEWEQPLIPGAKRMGSMFIACNPEEAEDIARAVIGEGARSTPAKIVEFRQNVRCRWIYITLDFLEFPFKNDGDHISGLRGPYHIGTISVAEDGTMLDFWMSHATAQIPKNESMQIAAASLVGWTALAMINCANVMTIEHKTPEAFQKARAKSGKRPLVSYHTVCVDLDKTPRQINAPSLTGNGTTPRLHKKRGHMKDYRKGKGLFGRYKGVWFWGDMTAGSEDEGVIVSDYKVTP
jgi:hypothetical protein